MTSLLDHAIEPFRLGLMQRALIQVVLISAVGGAVGCFVVIRGLSFTGESLAHTVLPGVVVAYAVGVSLLLGAALLAAVTVAISLLAQRDRRIAEDTAMGVAFAGLFPLVNLLFFLRAILYSKARLAIIYGLLGVLFSIGFYQFWCYVIVTNFHKIGG